MQFQRDWPKDKKIQLFNFLPQNLTKLNDAPQEGSTIFLYRSSLGHTALESYQLAELKYATFSWTGRNTKELRPSKLFLSTVFKAPRVIDNFNSIQRHILELYWHHWKAID